MATVEYRMKQKRDSEADWTTENPVLLDGEFGVESDTGRFKIGDGSTAWNDLDYAGGGAGATEEYTAAEAITTTNVLAIDGSGEAQIADISDIAKRDVIGVATETVIATDEVIVQKIGHVDGFVGLTIGEVYYLDTAGGIDTADNITSGYPLIRVGMAVSATILDVSLEDETASLVDHPIGMIFPHGGTTAPEGSLICDGSAISRDVYSDLFAVIGEGWGSGDGSTTFNIPDLRGAFLRGTGSHGTETMADGNPFEGPSIANFENDQFQGHEHWMRVRTADDGDPSADEVFQSGDVRKGTYGVQAFWESMDPVDDGTNGTPRDGDETRPFAAGVIWCIKAAPILTLPDPVTVGTFRYDTGWQSYADFSDVSININHALDTPLEELIVKVWVKRDASSVPVNQPINITAESGVLATNSVWGSTIQEVDNDNLEIVTGLNGILYINAAGSVSGLTDGEMRVLVYKPTVVAATYEQSLASFKYDTGWVANSDWTDMSEVITHNLDAPSSELIFRFMVSSTGADNTEISPIDISNSAAGPYGWEILGLTNDSVTLQTGSAGVQYLNSSGAVNVLDTESWYYRVVVYKPEIMADIIPTTLTTWKFNTGWIANSDWTDMSLDIAHNLGAEMSDLIIKFFVSSNASDVGSIEVKDTIRTDGGGTSSAAGYQFERIDANTIRLQTGADGITYLNSSGVLQLLDTESWYYKIVVYNPVLLQETVDVGSVDFDISSTDQSYTLPSTNPLGQDIVITWSGGDGTYDLDIDPDAGFTLDGETAGIWKGEGEGKMIVRRINATEWIVVEYMDSDGGQWTDEGWEKRIDGTLNQWGNFTSGVIGIATAALGGFRSSGGGITHAYPLPFVAVPDVMIPVPESTAAASATRETASETASLLSVLCWAFSSQGGATRNIHWTATGRWK